jgi:hypothetical protein
MSVISGLGVIDPNRMIGRALDLVGRIVALQTAAAEKDGY